MSTPPVGSADYASSPALQRWLDALSQGASARATGAVRVESAGLERALAPRPDILPTDLTAHRLEPAALGAHAAVGELSVQRRTFAAVEHAISSSSRGLVAALDAVDEAYARAERSADEVAERRRAQATARRGDEAERLRETHDGEIVAARRALHAAIGEAVREFADTDARLTELRDAAREAVRDTAARVGTLADEVAAYARSGQADRWARAELDERTARSDERRRVALAGDAAARERRDASVRELGRLVGATTRENVDGTLDVVVGDRALVRGDRVEPVTVREDATGSITLRVPDGDLEGHSGALAALVQAGDRAVSEARSRVIEVGRAFAAEVERRQDLGRAALVERAAGNDPAATNGAGEARPLVEVAADGALRLVGSADDIVLAPATARFTAARVSSPDGPDEPGVDPRRASPTVEGPVDGVGPDIGVTSAAAGASPETGRTPGLAVGEPAVPGSWRSVTGQEQAGDVTAPPTGVLPVNGVSVAAAGVAAGPAQAAGPEGGPYPDGAGGPTASGRSAGDLPGRVSGGSAAPSAGSPDAKAAFASAGSSTSGDLESALSVAAAQGRFAAAVTGVLDDLLTQATRRRQVAERRLDVLSVVDSLLAGAPTSQVGGLVRAALGAVSAPGAGGWRTSQELVTAFQVLGGQTLALERSAEPIVAAPPATYATLSDEAAGITVGPAPTGAPTADVAQAGASLAAGRQHLSVLGRFGDLLGAVGAALTGSATPEAPYDARVDVVSVARAGAAVSQAAFPSGHVLAGGTPFTLTLTEGGGEQAVTHRVALRAGTTLQGVAEALNGVATHVRAAVVTAAGGGERLLLSGVGTGLRTRADVTDGRVATAPSAVLGAFHPVERASDTVVSVQLTGRPARTTSSPTHVVDDALPGLRLTVDAAATGRTVHVTAFPGAGELADRVEALTTSSDALLRSLGGAGVMPPAPAAALANDPVVGDLASRVAAALSGASAVPVHVAPTAGAALLIGDSGDPPPPTPVAGLRASTSNATFDRGAFLRAFAADPVGVEAAARSVAHEVRALAQDATDPRGGFLAVRILGEQTFAQGYSVGQTDADERMHDRHDAAQRRLDAMQTLLSRLDEQAGWLRAQVS